MARKRQELPSQACRTIDQGFDGASGVWGVVHDVEASLSRRGEGKGVGGETKR
jgi:hypothetical protein